MIKRLKSKLRNLKEIYYIATPFMVMYFVNLCVKIWAIAIVSNGILFLKSHQNILFSERIKTA